MLQAKRTSTARQRAFKAKTTWRAAINSFLRLQALHQSTREESAKLDQRNCLNVTLNVSQNMKVFNTDVTSNDATAHLRNWSLYCR